MLLLQREHSVDGTFLKNGSTIFDGLLSHGVICMGS